MSQRQSNRSSGGSATFELLSAVVALAITILRGAATVSAVGARWLAQSIHHQLPSTGVEAPPPPPPDNTAAVPQGVHHPPTNGRYYAISVGTQVGVFLGWHATAHHVIGVAGAVFHAYGSLADAQAAFQEALNAGNVRIVTQAGQPANVVNAPNANNGPQDGNAGPAN